MLLYDSSIKIDIPEGYKDISAWLVAQNYQYMFAKEGEADDFLIIDLMQPMEEIDLHIEDILAMNDVEDPKIQALEYTNPGFQAGIAKFVMRHKHTDSPKIVEKGSSAMDWMYSHIKGLVTRSDGKSRALNIFIGVTKYQMSDIVISMFKETAVTAKEIGDIKEMIQSVRVLNPTLFLPTSTAASS